jgi:hypothetical protein
MEDKLYLELGAKLPTPFNFTRNKYFEDTSENITTWRNKYSNTDVYSTVARYESLPIRESKQITPLYFDFDSKENLEIALSELNIVISIFRKFGCAENSIVPYFSGNAGFHLLIPFKALGIESDYILDQVFKVIAEDLQINKQLNTIDMSVYEKARLWRLPNSINSKSYLHKIPLYLEELDLPIHKILEKAQKPRLDFIYPQLSLWEKFASIYAQANQRLLASAKRKVYYNNPDNPFVFHTKPGRHAALLKKAIFYFNHYPAEIAERRLREDASLCEPPYQGNDGNRNLDKDLERIIQDAQKYSE